jgi:KaiC domain protein
MSEDDTADDGDWFERALRDDGDGDDGGVQGRDDGGAVGPEDDVAKRATEADDSTGSGGGADGDEGRDADWPGGSDGLAGETGDATGAGNESPFAGAAAGGPGEETGGGMFDDDFASAFESAGGGDDDFEEDYESEIPRIDLGIEGLDDMIQGGVPERHLLTCIGSAGSGKTTFGLQFLHHGLQHDQKGVFITLEQSHAAIIATAREHGWDFAQHEDEDALAVVDLDPVEMANSLDNIRGELPRLIEQFGADRLVLDSVSLLEMMYDDQAERRTEVFDFTRSLKKAGVTTFLTSEASEDNPYASRHGIIEYLTDGVFVLQYVRAETRETRLAVEIQKIRNANHSRETKPYEITSGGISVYQQANIF